MVTILSTMGAIARLARLKLSKMQCLMRNAPAASPVDTVGLRLIQDRALEATLARSIRVRARHTWQKSLGARRERTIA